MSSFVIVWYCNVSQELTSSNTMFVLNESVIDTHSLHKRYWSMSVIERLVLMSITIVSFPIQMKFFISLS